VRLLAKDSPPQPYSSFHFLLLLCREEKRILAIRLFAEQTPSPWSLFSSTGEFQSLSSIVLLGVSRLVEVRLSFQLLDFVVCK
jgi:hypothetical protein